MIDIINLAHGELIMLGAYITVLAYHVGVPLPLCMVLSFLGVGVFGIILERLVIRRFYKNKLNALVATFGISLILSQGVLIIFGPYLKSVPLPMGGFSYGGYSYSTYLLFLFGMVVFLVAAFWWLLYRTRLGMYMRATMQNPNMARSLGVDTKRIYALTFGLGAGLAGLTGALYAPTTTIVPLFGTTFIAPAFITVVIGGGANPIVGALGSGVFLSGISTPLSSTLGTFIGRIGLLMAALVVIRFLPNGISGYLQNVKRLRQRPELVEEISTQGEEGRES
jgi:branched-chain amino acid transport system permease protein